MKLLPRIINCVKKLTYWERKRMLLKSKPINHEKYQIIISWFICRIYNKLKKELEDKKKNVEKTIKSAGEAYYNRNRAEEELKAL